ncbi:MAG: PAN domain-containing protein [Myxococcota bacterium]
MRCIGFFLVSLSLLACGGGAPPIEPASGPGGVAGFDGAGDPELAPGRLTDGLVIPGNDIRVFAVDEGSVEATTEACRQACRDEAECVAFTIARPEGDTPPMCSLKSASVEPVVDTCCASELIAR